MQLRSIGVSKWHQRPADTLSHGGELLWGEGFVARLAVFCSVRGAWAPATPGDVPSAAGVLPSSREFLSASVSTRRGLSAACFKGNLRMESCAASFTGILKRFKF